MNEIFPFDNELKLFHFLFYNYIKIDFFIKIFIFLEILLMLQKIKIEQQIFINVMFFDVIIHQQELLQIHYVMYVEI